MPFACTQFCDTLAGTAFLQVICCTGARTLLTADLSRVEEIGVGNLAKAFLVWC